MTYPREDRTWRVLVFNDDLLTALTWKVSMEKLGITKIFLCRNLRSLKKAPIDSLNIDIAFVDLHLDRGERESVEVVRFLKKCGIPRVVAISCECHSRDEERLIGNDLSKIDFMIRDLVPESIDQFFRSYH